MAKLWNMNDDIHLVMYFEVAGAENCGDDLGRSAKACRDRFAKLEESGAARAIRKLKADEYSNLYTYFSCIGTESDLQSLDMHHGADIDQNGEWIVKIHTQVNEDRAKSHMLADCIEQGEIPANLTVEKIDKLYPDFWNTRILKPRLSIVK